MMSKVGKRVKTSKITCLEGGRVKTSIMTCLEGAGSNLK
jgi:hypothetical protein